MPKRLAPVTGLILILNVLFWLAGLVSGETGLLQAQGAYWPVRVEHALSGAPGPFPTDHVWLVPVWLTPISAAFLHAGALHLMMNMLVLLVVGQLLEPVMQSGRYALLYVLGAYGAAVGQYLADPGSTTPMVGASGAISALLAAYFLLFSRRRPGPLGPIPGRYVHMAWLAAAWIGISLLTGRVCHLKISTLL